MVISKLRHENVEKRFFNKSAIREIEEEEHNLNIVKNQENVKILCRIVPPFSLTTCFNLDQNSE